MEILHSALVFVHLIGFAALFGGLFVQIRSEPRVVNNAVLHGTLTQVLTGLLLVGVLEGAPTGADWAGEVDHVKIGVKFAVAVVIAILVLANRKKPSLPGGLFFGLLGLSVLNVGVAVFWT